MNCFQTNRNHKTQAFVNIRVICEVPVSQRNAALYIAGNLPALGDWKPNRVKLKRVAPKIFEYRFTAKLGSVVEFKITRGTWKSQALYENDPNTVPPDNRAFCIDNPEIYYEVVIKDWLDNLPASSDEIQGTIDIHKNFSGESLEYPRDIIVWRPPGFKRSKKYPVLYMHDGQNLFDPSTSFCGQDWKVDETAARLMKENKIDEIIVVGIYNTPDRLKEYNLFEPLGSAYAAFIIERIKPFIDAKYPTLRDRRHTATAGSSMGGLVSFQLAWLHPEIFSMAACLSPAFWFSRGRMYKLVNEGLLPSKPIKLYLDAGDLEPKFQHGCERMANSLRKRGFIKDKNLYSYIDIGAVHSEAAWAARFYKPLTFLFGKKA